MLPRPRGARPLWAVPALALLVLAGSLSPAIAVAPEPADIPSISDSAPGIVLGKALMLAPEQLEPQTLPTRPAQPLIEASFVTRPTPAPAPLSANEPTPGRLDPATDGLTRSSFPWGNGRASWYAPGNGVAMHYCSWTYRNTYGCGLVRITSLATGRSVVAPVIDYCECYWGTGDQRLVDLQTGLLPQLGLSTAAGIYQVSIAPAD